MKNENSDKAQEVYKKISQSNRNNETPYQAMKRFARIFYDTVTGRKNFPEQKQK